VHLHSCWGVWKVRVITSPTAHGLGIAGDDAEGRRGRGRNGLSGDRFHGGCVISAKAQFFGIEGIQVVVAHHQHVEVFLERVRV